MPWQGWGTQPLTREVVSLKMDWPGATNFHLYCFPLMKTNFADCTNLEVHLSWAGTTTAALMTFESGGSEAGSAKGPLRRRAV